MLSEIIDLGTQASCAFLHMWNLEEKGKKIKLEGEIFGKRKGNVKEV